MLSHGLGPLLKSARQQLGLSRDALASKADVSMRLVAEFERGQRSNVSLERAARAAITTSADRVSRRDLPRGLHHRIQRTPTSRRSGEEADARMRARAGGERNDALSADVVDFLMSIGSIGASWPRWSGRRWPREHFLPKVRLSSNHEASQ